MRIQSLRFFSMPIGTLPHEQGPRGGGPRGRIPCNQSDVFSGFFFFFFLTQTKENFHCREAISGFSNEKHLNPKHPYYCVLVLVHTF
jgi:hypothetical protein